MKIARSSYLHFSHVTFAVKSFRNTSRIFYQISLQRKMLWLGSVNTCIVPGIASPPSGARPIDEQLLRSLIVPFNRAPRYPLRSHCAAWLFPWPSSGGGWLTLNDDDVHSGIHVRRRREFDIERRLAFLGDDLFAWQCQFVPPVFLFLSLSNWVALFQAWKTWAAWRKGKPEISGGWRVPRQWVSRVLYSDPAARHMFLRLCDSGGEKLNEADRHRAKPVHDLS